MTIVFVIGGPNFGLPATAAHAALWAETYELTNPVLVDPEYETTGYLLPQAVSIPAEALLRPGVKLIDNPAPGTVDEAALEALVNE